MAHAILQRYSPWHTTLHASAANVSRGPTSVPPSAGALKLPPSMQTRRKYRLFWAGRATRHGARGDLFKHHSRRGDFLIHDTSGRYPVAVAASAASQQGLRATDHDFMPRGMANSDFCLSPLGQSEGDSDRYLPALLYGCIPIFTSEEEALPFDELLQWRAFSLTLPRGARQVVALPKFLSEVSDRQLWAMRRAMTHAWPRMLWSSVVQLVPGERERHGLKPEDEDTSYVGEPTHRDAFSALMAVLRLRMCISGKGGALVGRGAVTCASGRSRRPRSRHGSRP